MKCSLEAAAEFFITLFTGGQQSVQLWVCLTSSKHKLLGVEWGKLRTESEKGCRFLCGFLLGVGEWGGGGGNKRTKSEELKWLPVKVSGGRNCFGLWPNISHLKFSGH